jgi:predicted branched-subunit amino acid permease
VLFGKLQKGGLVKVTVEEKPEGGLGLKLESIPDENAQRKDKPQRAPKPEGGPPKDRPTGGGVGAACAPEGLNRCRARVARHIPRRRRIDPDLHGRSRRAVLPLDPARHARGPFRSGLILLLSMAGFGALCRETGLTLGQAMFSTAAIWALPSQVVLVGAIAGGASIATAALGVALSAVRFLPMIASWVPMVRNPQTKRWQLSCCRTSSPSHPGSWRRCICPKFPAEARIRYFAGFAITLTTAGTVVTGASYVIAGTLPPVLAGALSFLTPIYFLTALTTSSRLFAERFGLVLGLALGPLFRLWEVPLDIVWAGLIGGTIALPATIRGSQAMMPGFDTYSAAWWPYLFILIAGTLATEVWRWLAFSPAVFCAKAARH